MQDNPICRKARKPEARPLSSIEPIARALALELTMAAPPRAMARGGKRVHGETFPAKNRFPARNGNNVAGNSIHTQSAPEFRYVCFAEFFASLAAAVFDLISIESTHAHEHISSQGCNFSLMISIG